MPSTPAWLGAVEALLNRGAQAGTQAAALAQRLDGTSLDIHVTGIASIRASLQHGRIGLVTVERPGDIGDAGPADASIIGSPAALLQLAAGAVDRSFASSSPGGKISIQGDAEIANLYRQFLTAARPDLEEELSRWVGDVAAHRLSLVARRTFDWARRAHRTTAQNISEYLLEESRDLVGRQEVDEFLAGVDLAREAADRIEARIARLENATRK